LNLAKRAWMAMEKARKSPKKLNKKTKKYEKPQVRFKSFTRDPLLSIEAKSSKSSMRWDAKKKQMVWGSILIDAILEENDPYTQFLIDNPEAVKFARIKRTNIKGEWRYVAQLCCVGTSVKHIDRGVGDVGDVGIDIGPEKYAIVSNNLAIKDVFCKELINIEKQIAKLQKQCAIKTRLNNPDCFEDDFIRKNSNGKSIWKQGKIKDRKTRP
jgi:arginine deiminase